MRILRLLCEHCCVLQLLSLVFWWLLMDFVCKKNWKNWCVITESPTKQKQSTDHVLGSQYSIGWHYKWNHLTTDITSIACVRQTFGYSACTNIVRLRRREKKLLIRRAIFMFCYGRHRGFTQWVLNTSVSWKTIMRTARTISTPRWWRLCLWMQRWWALNAISPNTILRQQELFSQCQKFEKIVGVLDHPKLFFKIVLQATSRILRMV